MHATPMIVDTSCSNFGPITYAVPSRTTPETADNRYDTPETVAQVQQHNARFDALCPKGN